MSRFIPYILKWDDAPIDISHVFQNEKPAGRHGFVVVKDDKLVFEDGTPARFFGTLFNSGMNFCSHEHAEKVARRLAKFGLNIVRLHQLDSEWALPNIFTFERGPHENATHTLDPRSMERLDYLIYCLKQNGLYLYMDGINYRMFKSGDGVRNAWLLTERAAKPYSIFDPTMIELQKKYNRDLLTHYNPYTGLRYCDDPAVALFAMSTETTMFGTNWTVKIEPYKSELEARFRAWAAENGHTVDQVDLTDRSDPVLRSFYVSLEQAYYTAMHDDLRMNGVRIPLCGDNWGYSVDHLTAQADNQFSDSHSYSYIGDHRRFMNDPISDKKHTLFVSYPFSRLAEKPFFISEWDMPWPNEYRAEAALFMASMASFQGFSGMTVHTYRYGCREEEAVTRRLGRDLVLGNSYYRGTFDTYNDPAKFGLFYHAALIMRRGDVREADQWFKIRLKHHTAYKPNSTAAALPALMSSLIYEHKVSMLLDGMPDQGTVCIDADEAGEDKAVLVSDTGELVRDLGQSIGTIDTPMTKAAYGFIGGKDIRLDGLAIRAQTDFGTIALSSLTQDPIEKSKNLLLTAVGRAQNTDFRAEPREDSGFRVVDSGKPPILVEAIEAEVRFHTDRRDLRVISIDDEGFITGTVKSWIDGDECVMAIGQEFAQIYYLIQAQ